MRHSLVLVLLTAANTTSTLAQDYFPLHIGNQWVYRFSFAGRSGTAQIDIPRSETQNGRVYSVVRGFAETPVLLRMGDDGTLIRFNPDTGQEENWASFGTPEGQTYRTAINTCNQTAKVDSRKAKVSLPAAEFDNALAISYPAANCADAGLESEVYAPYIGLVQRSSITIAGPRVMRLTYARVGGVTVLSQPETSFTLALDHNVFPDNGPAVTVRMTLRNTASRPLELNFSSGQRFNLVIRNARSQEVYNWAATRTFIAVLGRERIDQGELNWVEMFPLASLDGKPLPPGKYTMEAIVTSLDERPRFAATAGFEILATPAQ